MLQSIKDNLQKGLVPFFETFQTFGFVLSFLMLKNLITIISYKS